MNTKDELALEMAKKLFAVLAEEHLRHCAMIGDHEKQSLLLYANNAVRAGVLFSEVYEAISIKSSE